MPDDLRRSPLHDVHLAAGAKLVAFGGYSMPLAYPTGTVAEHLACRRSAVCFDVSHLGTVRVQGSGAFDRLQQELSNDLRRIGPGRAQYSHLLADDGSVVDDVIVWWVGADRFDVMPNATNTEQVRSAVGGVDTTAQRAVLAVQGPTARSALATLWPDAALVDRFVVAELDWHGTPCLVAGTGYTGEDGVEIAVPVSAAAALWAALVGAGIVPAGLGARDTLRLEAGLPLHGHELGLGITPLQAGLGWVVGWDKPKFRGRQALAEERRDGPRRRLRGLVGETARPLRAGADVSIGDRTVGICTSGSFSPVLGRGIALAFIETGAGVQPAPRAASDYQGSVRDPDALADGAPVTVTLRSGATPATIVRPPFVSLPGGR